MSTPKIAEPVDEKKPENSREEKKGTNAVEHEPDPDAEPLADGQHRHIPRSPYTTGNS